LGTGNDLDVRFAINTRTSVGFQARWRGNISSQSSETPFTRSVYDYSTGSSSSYSAKMATTTDEDQLDLTAAIPLEWTVACKGSVCATGSVGPMIRVVQRESSTHTTDSYSLAYMRNDLRQINYGLQATAGVRWEFLPGLALASEFGADGSYYTRDGKENMYGVSETTIISETGYSSSSWFGGIGLDYWF